MAGRNPAEAVSNFLDPLQRALACVTRGKFVASAGGRHTAGVVHALVLNGDDGAELRGGFKLWARMQYRIVQTDDPERGPWKVSTCAYDHALRRADGTLILSFHWHPLRKNGMTRPHLHIGKSELAADGVLNHKAHVPTSRVAFEEVIAFAIMDLGITPLNDVWRDVLSETRGAFVKYRTWSDAPDASP